MKIHFSPAEQQIVDILRDRQFHCVYNELKMKDDRARITSIRRKLQERGYDIVSERCNLHQHRSQILLRKIVKLDSLLEGEYGHLRPLGSGNRDGRNHSWRKKATDAESRISPLVNYPSKENLILAQTLCAQFDEYQSV